MNSSVGSIVLWVVLIAVLIVMLILPTFTQRKRNKEFMQMIDSIKVGDTVRTAGGIIGRVTKIMDKGEIKTVILETGSKTDKSYMEFDIQMIGAVLKSTRVEENNDSSKPAAAEKTETEENADEQKTEAKENAEISNLVEGEEKQTENKKKARAKTAVKKSGKSKK